MPHTPHELAEEFPDHTDVIHKLKIENAHFARIFDEYHDVNGAIHRSETNVEPTDDLNDQAMRKQRLALKDELWGMLQQG